MPLEDPLGLGAVAGAGDGNCACFAGRMVESPCGAPEGNGPAGESYGVVGKAGTTPVSLSNVAAGTGGFVINGIDSGDFSSYSVSGAGDINGDGLADLIVGAMYADPGGGLEGES